VNAKALTNINLAIGGFVVVTNGGASVMMLGDRASWSTAQLVEALLYASVGLGIVLIGVLALIARLPASRAVALQGALLAALVFLLLCWGVSLVLRGGTDAEPHAVWMVGLLTSLAWYVGYLLKNVLSAERLASLRVPLLLGLVVVALVDVAVFLDTGFQ
jgi:hypothetical protein